MTTTGFFACIVVKLNLFGKLREVMVRHSIQRQKMSNSHWVSASVLVEQFKLIKMNSLKWYLSLNDAHRQFYTGCKLSQYFQSDCYRPTTVEANTLNNVVGLHTKKNIYVKIRVTITASLIMNRRYRSAQKPGYNPYLYG